MATLIDAMKKEQAWKLTENGQVALNTTFDAMLDMFGTIGALRERSDLDIINMFMKAWAENSTLALKMLFYCRDCRGGQGEKRTFKIIAEYLANNHTEEMRRNLKFIPEYGRWDDLYIFDGTELEIDAYNMIAAQFIIDERSSNPSVLAKWMKSENTSSAESRWLATKTRLTLGLSSKEYRKALSELRKKIDVVEKKMSANQWKEINYSGVPSIAHKNYRSAFNRHDKEGYKAFLTKVENGEEEIKASQLFPYDIVRSYLGEHYCNLKAIDSTLEAQWKAMPKYLTDKKYLVMADISGSMTSNHMLPMATSIGLAIKFAEENTGIFGNNFITFSDKPQLITIPENLSLREKVAFILQSEHVGYDTNLAAAFNLVLKSAVNNKLAQEDMPEAILVISDMEINDCEGYYESDIDFSVSFTDEMKEKFAKAGYTMPILIYWNVNARNNTFHATKNDNVRFVSGSSPSVFKDLCENMGSSAADLMMNILLSERYEQIK